MKACFVLAVKEPARLGKLLCLCGEGREREAKRSTLPEQMTPFCHGKRNFTLLQLKDEIFRAWEHTGVEIREDRVGQKEDLGRVLLGSSVLLATKRDVSRLKWEITFAHQLNNSQSLSEANPKPLDEVEGN